MGMGHLWLKWVGHLGLNGWGSYGKVSCCFFMLKKHWSSVNLYNLAYGGKS